MSIYRLKGTAGPIINQSFVIEDRILIGGSDDCDIQLEGVDPDMALAEVSIEHDGGVVLRALAISSEVSVNGEQVSVANLGGGDEIRLGGNRLILQAPGLRPERVLTEDAVKPSRPVWPWILAAAVLAGATAAAWYAGWLEGLL